MDNKLARRLWLIVGGLVALSIVAMLFIVPRPRPAPAVIRSSTEKRATATTAPHRDTATDVAPVVLSSTATPAAIVATVQPLAVATMVVGSADDPRVLVLIVTPQPDMQATQPDTRPPRAPSSHGVNSTSPLPTPISPLPTPVSPLPTPQPPATLPPASSAAPDQDTQQAVYDLLDSLIAAEGNYYQQHGRYAQLLLADSSQCPTGQACISVPYPAGVLAGVDVYLSPDGGVGYEVRVSVNGWQLTVAAGPEAWRSEGWHYEN